MLIIALLFLLLNSHLLGGVFALKMYEMQLSL